jgi:hypothetical protein
MKLTKTVGDVSMTYEADTVYELIDLYNAFKQLSMPIVVKDSIPDFSVMSSIPDVEG